MTIKSKSFRRFDTGFMMMLQSMITDFERGYPKEIMSRDLDQIHGFVTGMLFADVLTHDQFEVIWDALTEMYFRMIYDER